MSWQLRIPVLLPCVGVILLIAGCSTSDDAVSPAKKAAEPKLVEADTPKGNKVADSKAEAKPEPRRYRAPFPRRTDLFTPVQRKRVAKRSDQQSGESVVLKGFANVDQPKAVLAIDGRITSVGIGVERFGVQVISIEPPEVVLQRGRSRWTAKLQ